MSILPYWIMRRPRHTTSCILLLAAALIFGGCAQPTTEVRSPVITTETSTGISEPPILSPPQETPTVSREAGSPTVSTETGADTDDTATPSATLASSPAATTQETAIVSQDPCARAEIIAPDSDEARRIVDAFLATARVAPGVEIEELSPLRRIDGWVYFGASFKGAEGGGFLMRPLPDGSYEYAGAMVGVFGDDQSARDTLRLQAPDAPPDLIDCIV